MNHFNKDETLTGDDHASHFVDRGDDSRLLHSNRGAQWIKKPSDLDPFNRNGSVNKTARQFDQERLREMSRSPRPGRDYTKVYLKNEAGRTIWVATLHQPYQFPSNASELKYYDPSADGWSQQAWYRLAPGQRVHVAYTNNINFYTYAKDNKGGTWSGRNIYRIVGGRSLGFSKKLINAPYTVEHTIRFTR